MYSITFVTTLSKIQLHINKPSWTLSPKVRSEVGWLAVRKSVSSSSWSTGRAVFRDETRAFHNNNNNNLTCKAPVCAKKTSVALKEWKCFQEWIAPKWLEIDQDNLHMEFSAWNVAFPFSSRIPDTLLYIGSRWSACARGCWGGGLQSWDLE